MPGWGNRTPFRVKAHGVTMDWGSRRATQAAKRPVEPLGLTGKSGKGSRMEYRNLKKALEVLTEGGKARIPERLRGAADGLFQQHRSWLADAHIQGFGIAARSVSGRWRPDLALKVYVDRKLPASDIGNPAPSEVRLPGKIG